MKKNKYFKLMTNKKVFASARESYRFRMFYKRRKY